MKLSFKDILSVIIIFQLLFLFVFLITNPKGKRISNILLGNFFLAVCFNFTDGILILDKAYFNYPSFAFIGNNFSLLYGPLLYLHTQSVIQKNFRLKSSMLLHSIPFCIFVLFSVITYHLQSDDMKRYILSQAGKQQAPAVLYIIGSLLYVQFYTYAFIMIRNINKFRRKINNHFSEFTRVNLNWLSFTIILFMIVIGIGMINSFISITPLTNYFNITLTIIIVTIFLFITQILFKAIQYPSIFEGIKEEENAVQSAIISPAITRKKEIRYAGSSLSGDEKEFMKQQLVNYMQQEKPYLEPQLMLEELADMLKIKPRILSQVINESFTQNFFDFINRYRIEEAKRLLSNPADKRITVLEVLYQVGFNSKSSFNTLFKRYTGVTPSEFKKSNAAL